MGTMAETVRPANQTPASAAEAAESPVLAWIEARRKYLFAGATVVVVLGLGAWFLVESGRRKEAFAQQALEQARAAMDNGNLPQAASDFQKVSQGYADTDAAMEATLALNQVRIMSGQGQLAVENLRRFVSANPPAWYLSAGQTLLGVALENTGKPADAAAAYLQAAEAAKEDYRKVEAMLSAARAYRLAGKDREAVETLQTIVKKFPQTPGNAEAQVRLAELTKGRM